MKKVKNYIYKYTLLSEGQTVIVAVSGGPDSLALLHMLKTIADEFKLQLVVAHLNHGLRPEADEEEAEVKSIASNWSLSYETKSVNIRSLKKDKRLTEEEAGREARYRFLFDLAQKYDATRIALGHHLDDQAETVLLNVIRGTGVDGLAGILPKYKREDLLLIRPLLCLRRHEIEDYCRVNNLQPVTDSSNLETDYTRNKIRLELIPQIEKLYNPRIREALYGLAILAAEDRLFLQNLARKKYLKIARFGRGETFFRKHDLIILPVALSGRILRLAHKKYALSKQLGRKHIEQILKLVESNKTAGQVTLPGGSKAYISQKRLVLTGGEVQKQDTLTEIALMIPGKTLLPGGKSIEARIKKVEEMAWLPSRYRAYIDFDRLPPGRLTVRPRWPGARFYPQGAPGSKKLKSILIDQKIPRCQREILPLVTVQKDIVWIPGIRIAHPYRVTDQTTRVLLLEYKIPRIK